MRPGAGLPPTISEIPDISTPRRRGRPRTRIEVGEVPRLHLPHLVETGRVVVGQTVRRALAWDLADGSEVAVIITADVGPEGGRLLVQHGTRAAYEIEMVSALRAFGGRRWWLVCPATGQRTPTLYLAPGADRFTSRQAAGLGYRSQRFDARARAAGRAVTAA